MHLTEEILKLNDENDIFLTKDSPEWDQIKFFNPKTDPNLCCRVTGECKISLKLMMILDTVRFWMEEPIYITSGYRSENHPLTIRNPTSSHPLGLALDIAATTSRMRYRLIEHFMIEKTPGGVNLVRRLGINKQAGFIHVDIDPNKEQDLIWLY